MSTVFIAFQANEETRPIIEAIEVDNAAAEVVHEPAMVKVNAPGHLVINRETIEELIGRPLRPAGVAGQPHHLVGKPRRGRRRPDPDLERVRKP